MFSNYTQKIVVLLLSIVSVFNLSAQDRPFITIWQTDNEGVTEDNQIEIPAYGNYTIEWEEVDNTANNGTNEGSGPVVLNFPSAGTYRVKLNGGLEYIKFVYPTRDNYKIIEIEQWGDIQWTQLTRAFYFCNRLARISADDSPNLENITSLGGMFSWMSVDGDNVLSANLSNWDVSNIESFGSMFSRTDFEADITNWDTSSARSMYGMFTLSNFNADISHWDVSKVTTMFEMFASTPFDNDISAWNVNHVTNMGLMFANTPFNQDIGDWNVSNVTNFYNMFINASDFDQNLSSWDISSVEKGFKTSDFTTTYDGLEGMFDKSGMSIFNYDSTLIGWSELENLPTNHEVGSDSLFYCRGAEARQKFIDDLGWSFAGDQQKCLNYPTVYPENNSTSINLDTEIYIVFNEEIESINSLGNQITINSAIVENVNIKQDTIFISFDSLLKSNTNYTISIPEYVFSNQEGASIGKIEWSFTTGTKVLSNKTPSIFKKIKVYPNPFSTSTTIQFELKKEQKAELFIYDIKGSIVRQQNNLYLEAGTNIIKIEKANLPTGLYHFILRSSEGEIKNKFVIE